MMYAHILSNNYAIMFDFVSYSSFVHVRMIIANISL